MVTAERGAGLSLEAVELSDRGRGGRGPVAPQSPALRVAQVAY